MKKIHYLGLIILFVFRTNNAFACVAEVTSFATKNFKGLALTKVVNIKNHTTIEDCNSSARSSSESFPKAVPSEIWDNIDSISFSCVVPILCTPPDIDKEEPYYFVFLKTRLSL
ncbi:hypothetical protein [Paraglaciecola sp. 25GB23A]|uniref:hypothetical protein n=1 Tax=Paraglaciecola sp. 25GB23A TaxID=3156068 RepID=UPI0032AE9156